MVSCCANPACSTEFRFLNSGDLYALERQSADTEFFWLCSACVPALTLYLDSRGHVSVRSRSDAVPPQPSEPIGRLWLVYSPPGRLPRFQIGPARELALLKRISASPHSSPSEAA